MFCVIVQRCRWCEQDHAKVLVVKSFVSLDQQQRRLNVRKNSADRTIGYYQLTKSWQRNLNVYEIS